MANKSILGIGVISLGWMGRLHSRSYRAIAERFPELGVTPRLVAAADPVEEVRQEAVDNLGFERAYADYRDLLADPEVEAVSICAPNFLHHEMALAAVEAGARQVQGCVNGFGERTGNANLLTLIADLELKSGWTVLPGDDAERARRLSELSAVSRTVDEIANRASSGRLPYVGTRAFAHKAGLHASAIRVDPDLYQHIDPARVGNTTTMLVSEMAGRASIELKARELGIDTGGDAELLGRVTEMVKAREAAGYAYDAADGSFELLLRSARGDLPAYFRVESWRASIQARPRAGEVVLPADGRTDTEAEATVRLRIGGRRRAVLGEGNGPVNALDRALCDALAETYPEIRRFELTDFKVRILDSERGTRSIVRVLIDITDGERTWSTVGVGTDIIEASWEALTDGHTVGLLRAGVVPR